MRSLPNASSRFSSRAGWWMRSEFHGTGAGRESSRETLPTTSLRAWAIRIQKFPRRKFFCATSEKRVAHQSSAEVRKNRNRTTTTKDAKVTKGREELQSYPKFVSFVCSFENGFVDTDPHPSLSR